jgi:hypothetical protein
LSALSATKASALAHRPAPSRSPTLGHSDGGSLLVGLANADSSSVRFSDFDYALLESRNRMGPTVASLMVPAEPCVMAIEQIPAARASDVRPVTLAELKSTLGSVPPWLAARDSGTFLLSATPSAVFVAQCSPTGSGDAWLAFSNRLDETDRGQAVVQFARFLGALRQVGVTRLWVSFSRRELFDRYVVHSHLCRPANSNELEQWRASGLSAA